MDPAAADLVIAPMRRRHLPAVLAIEEQVQPRPWSERIFRSELGQPNRCYLVAHHDAEVVGFAGALLVVDEGHVTNVAVETTPDSALGACVAAAVQKASFSKTQNGGSFSYPFVF